MNQSELARLFDWANSELAGDEAYEVSDCDESEHYYFRGEMVGGWAGDTQTYFFKHNNNFVALLNAYDESRA